MSSIGGFSFGARPTTATTATTATGFGAPAAAPSGGFSFGATTTSSATTQPTGIGFGMSQPASTGGLTFGAPASTTTQSSQGGGSLGFNFGTPATTTTAQASGGFSFGTPASTTTQAATGFGLGGTTPATTSAATTGLGLFNKTTASTSASTGSFGFAKPLTLGGTTTTTSSGGFGFGTPATSASTGFGLTGGLKLGTTTAATTAAGFGGLGATPASGTSIFGPAVTKTTASGLGGLDPKTTTSAVGSTADGVKASDGKTAKETDIHSVIVPDIDNFKKFVKEEKSETEHIKRMSSTPMVKVQEDTAALKQLLSVVSSGLQKNASAVEKLKREMTQELKNAEMAIRTKDIPPGLQYENTAPTQYFQLLVEDFETQMLSYRQQIEMLENHLASLHQPNRLTSEELVLLLRKLHEAFVALAAKLQQVHEAVKTQKEHYLNYLRVFRGDNRNIFESQKKAPVRVPHARHLEQFGQSPFPGITDAAAVAMAAALTRSQQPQTHTGTGPPVTGLGNFGAPTGFSTSLPQPAGFPGFGAGGTGLFGGTSNLTTTQSGPSFGSTTAPVVGTAAPQLNLSAATEQPFQLNKPPVGAKRGKR